MSYQLTLKDGYIILRSIAILDSDWSMPKQVAVVIFRTPHVTFLMQSNNTTPRITAIYTHIKQVMAQKIHILEIQTKYNHLYLLI